MRHWLFVLVVLAVGVRDAAAQGPRIEKDVVYGTGGGEELRLDVCRPLRGSGPFPVVVCIHGGAWQAGHRAAHHATIQALAREGFVAATIQYRLAPRHRWPAQIEDAMCAVRFLRSRATAWNLDPKRVAALGDSAGGHLSLLVGLMKDRSAFEGKGGHAEHSSRVQAVVNYYGPTDFASWRLLPIGEALLKGGLKKSSEDLLVDLVGTADKSAAIMKTLSPITYVARDNPPVLTFQGTADPLVPDQQARVLHEALTRVGAPNRLEILENASHGWGGPLRERTDRITLEFLRERLGK